MNTQLIRQTSTYKTDDDNSHKKQKTEGGFLQNSHKYKLGSLRKTPHRGHSTNRSRSLVRQLALIPTTNQNTEDRYRTGCLTHSSFKIMIL